MTDAVWTQRGPGSRACHHSHLARFHPPASSPPPAPSSRSAASTPTPKRTGSSSWPTSRPAASGSPPGWPPPSGFAPPWTSRPPPTCCGRSCPTSCSKLLADRGWSVRRYRTYLAALVPLDVPQRPRPSAGCPRPTDTRRPRLRNVLLVPILTWRGGEGRNCMACKGQASGGRNVLAPHHPNVGRWTKPQRQRSGPPRLQAPGESSQRKGWLPAGTGVVAAAARAQPRFGHRRRRQAVVDASEPAYPDAIH